MRGQNRGRPEPRAELGREHGAFCIDSSRSLINQYLIRDHMMFHYNRILSAKAAVDCSVPRSRLTSIKLADQQRREKLKKKIARCEKEMSVSKSASRSSSRESGRLLSTSFGKQEAGIQLTYSNANGLQIELCQVKRIRCSFITKLQFLYLDNTVDKSPLEVEEKDNLFSYAEHTPYLSRALSPYGEHSLLHSSPVEHARKHSRNRSNTSNSNSSVSTPRKRSGVSSRCSSDSFVSISHSQRRQERNSRICSGDLLERHSELFTNGQKPFTPRTLISDAKSSLLGYRYYTAAQRKRKKRCKQHAEAQTQTDVISFPSTDKASERKVMTEQRKMTVKTEDKRYNMDEPEREIAAFPYSFLREDDLLYLTFIEDITNEILDLGLFSNRVLEQLFECHIQENKNRLDESKMRHLLDVLKADLGCSPGSGAEQSHAGWEAFGSLDLEELNMTEQLEATSRRQRQNKSTKSEGFFMDLLLREPSTYEVPLCSENSKRTESKDDFSEDADEMMNAETEAHARVKSEDPDASPSCEETLNLIACDSDLDANKELDGLEENFAEVLQITRDHS
ncbi:UNVERIFIED_CONTAM: hypothetical protein H355_009521 [Colinus virginianus]|nr:hypothetical protein H355_009521 [Colinus virginianus]